MATRLPTLTSEAPDRRDVGAVVNAVMIMRCLAAAAAPQSSASLARSARVNPSTCFNILRTLVREGLVAHDPAAKTYRLGLGFAEFVTVAAGLSAADLIRPELERLALNFGVTIALWRVTEDEHIMLADRASPPAIVRIEMRVGQRIPLWAGAVGRCAAAVSGLSAQELRRRYAQLQWQVSPGFDEYMAEVERARDAGWAVDEGKLYRALTTVAAIITDQGGKARMGLSAIALAGELAANRIAALGSELSQTAALVRRSLFPPSRLDEEHITEDRMIHHDLRPRRKPGSQP